MIACFILVSMFLTVVEISLRSRGLILPLLPCWIFYLSVVYGWKKTTGIALLLGVTMDLLCGCSFPIHIFTYNAVQIPANIWLKRVESDSFASLLFPGAILPLIVYIPQTLLTTWQNFIYFLPYLVSICLVTALLLPVMILLLDSLANLLSFPLYANVKLQMKRGDYL
ncbi:MAG: hypothetical protein IKB16_16090 [Lentisphaeria bacterium]|nr:hypothetical protein [Lentisphaeria bacterium]